VPDQKSVDREIMEKKGRSLIITRQLLATVPNKPGVYLMVEKTGRVLYVGKARDLRKRLATYGHEKGEPHNKTAVMLAKVDRIETILTNTEKEAFILEASLIKKHKPRYNIVLRDDKNYPLIKVTVAEEWPRVVMTRRRKKDGARYFGPYSSAGAMWETLRYLNCQFPLRRCKTKKLMSRKRPCLNYQMNRCLAPCAGMADRDTYRQNVEKILMVLGGKGRALIRELEKRMQQAADKLQFEEAAQCRDQVGSLKKTLEKQVITSSHELDQDVFGLAREGAAVAIAVLFVRHGVVTGQQLFYFPEPLDSDPEILAESIRQFYSEDRPIPDEILLPYDLDDRQLISEWLTDLKMGKLAIRIPKVGARAELMGMARANAIQVHRDREKRSQTWARLALSASTSLRLQFTPNRIECLDISNIGDRQAVGAIVCYVHGEKEKSQYRRYTIRTVPGPDDYRMMREVLKRRLKGDRQMPDLLMLDGGRGQLNIAAQVVDELGMGQAFDLVAIAKERDDEGEKLYRPGRKNPILLAEHSPVLLLFKQIRDEAHRFAITYHRKVRHRELFGSQLDEIPGVGPARKKALLKDIGSLQEIAAASEETLAAVRGIGPDLAAQIFKHFHAVVE
jgi:excinuclease ABC subunit C